MNDEQTPPSGSRWEPAPAQDGIAPPTDWLPTETPSAGGGSDGDTGTRTRRPGRAVVVGAGLALVLGGGAGGFVLGRAIAGGGTVVPTSASDGQRPGVDGRLLDGGRLGDPDGDDDHGRFGTPPGGTAPDGTGPGGTAPDGSAQEGGTQGSTT